LYQILNNTQWVEGLVNNDDLIVQKKTGAVPVKDRFSVDVSEFISNNLYCSPNHMQYHKDDQRSINDKKIFQSIVLWRNKENQPCGLIVTEVEAAAFKRLHPKTFSVYHPYGFHKSGPALELDDFQDLLSQANYYNGDLSYFTHTPSSWLSKDTPKKFAILEKDILCNSGVGLESLSLFKKLYMIPGAIKAVPARDAPVTVRSDKVNPYLQQKLYRIDEKITKLEKQIQSSRTPVQSQKRRQKIAALSMAKKMMVARNGFLTWPEYDDILQAFPQSSKVHKRGLNESAVITILQSCCYVGPQLDGSPPDLSPKITEHDNVSDALKRDTRKD